MASWLDALLGALFDGDGNELEILGGLKFSGFTITPAEVVNARGDTVQVYDINVDTAALGFTSDDIDNESGVAGATVSDALDALAAAIPPADNSIALAKLTNATAQFDFIMRVTAGAGAWERGTRANLVTAIDSQHVATLFGTPVLRVGAVGGTYPTIGSIRMVNAETIYSVGVGALAGTNLHLASYGADNVARFGSSSAVEVDIISGGNVDINNGTAGALNYRFGQTSGLDLMSKPLVAVTTLNGARVAAPTQGTAITTTATINVANGVKYDVSSAGGAYAITLGTSGTPVDGETVTLRTTAALANAITVTNGGTGGGNLGPDSGTIPAGMHAEYYYYYDGTATAWKYGSRQRTQ
jgi:hypothetical protein